MYVLPFGYFFNEPCISTHLAIPQEEKKNMFMKLLKNIPKTECPELSLPKQI